MKFQTPVNNYLFMADLDLKTMQQVAACGYEPIERKGKGTYGFVYEVGDVRGDLFAFKYLVPDKTYQQSGLDSLNEIDVLSRVHHPYIIHAARVITAFNCDIDGLAIILPLAERTLHDIMTDVAMTTERKLPLLYKLATALRFLHASHILHLDIKTTNVVLQGDTPYLIDFGLSMIVDNVTVGKYDHNLRVTIDHRAPEIVNGGRIYNAAVDIWAFGIMMMYTLTGRRIYNIDFNTVVTPAQMSAAITDKFTNAQTIPTALAGIRDQYRGPAIDLLSRILQVDPTLRPTAREICDHPLFDDFRQEVNGTLDTPNIAYDYANDHREILKVMLNWARILYPQSRAELLFLAVDLFNRVDSFYKDREVADRDNLAAASLWVAAKLTDAPISPLNVYVTEIVKLAPNVTATSILGNEIAIVHLLSGVLHVSKLYTECTTGDELKFSYNHIIIAKDPTLYARADVPAWIQAMHQYIPNRTYRDKNITIAQLIA
jgi:serine/threonine protein kinase